MVLDGMIVISPMYVYMYVCKLFVLGIVYNGV